MNILCLIHPQDPSLDNIHPFYNPDNVSMILIALISKLGIIKGFNPTSDKDEDLLEMYNENSKLIAEKSQSKCTVLLNGLKVVYSLDVRDAVMMVIHSFLNII